MKQLLILVLAVLPFYSIAQKSGDQVTIITKDSLKPGSATALKLDKSWRFQKRDSLVYADPSFDDHGWEVVKAHIRSDSGLYGKNVHGSRVDWYRLHLYLDSSLLALPLAISLEGYGAYEIYLDGKQIKAYGQINTQGISTCIDPESEPVIFCIKSPGYHLLAVRFANYFTGSSYEFDQFSVTGFEMSIGESNSMVLNVNRFLKSDRGFIFLFSVFLTLSLIHLVIFLYYRSIISNLYFSIFCLSVSFFFLVSQPFKDADTTHLFLKWLSPLFFGILCFSFSGINNALFSRNKITFRLVAVLFLLALGINLVFGDAFNSYSFYILAVTVLLEAFALTIIGIRRKVNGARIIGSGILVFTVLVFTLASIGFFATGGVNITIGAYPRGTLDRISTLMGICLILSIPVSMSVFLSWNFANINNELKKNLLQVQLLSEKNLEQEREKKKILENQKDHLEQEVEKRTEELVQKNAIVEEQKQELVQKNIVVEREKHRSDELLLNILPAEVAEELKDKGSAGAKLIDEVTVLFTDFKGFTQIAEKLSPRALVAEINDCFSAFDNIMDKYGVEKIKTIGDSYMAAGGLPTPNKTHAEDVVKAALEIQQFMQAYNQKKEAAGEPFFEIRIGVHTGPVVAGIVGVKKFQYDIWGDTVNTASRMEQHSEAGKINISQTTYELVKDKYNCGYRGEIDAKGKGAMKMYFVG